MSDLQRKISIDVLEKELLEIHTKTIELEKLKKY
jgi:hypothetical protein